jgi:hypothetical protein
VPVWDVKIVSYIDGANEVSGIPGRAKEDSVGDIDDSPTTLLTLLERLDPELDEGTPSISDKVSVAIFELTVMLESGTLGNTELLFGGAKDVVRLTSPLVEEGDDVGCFDVGKEEVVACIELAEVDLYVVEVGAEADPDVVEDNFDEVVSGSGLGVGVPYAHLQTEDN